MGFQLSLSRGLENKQFSDHLFEEVPVRKQGDKLGTGKKTRKSYKRDVGNWSPLETHGKQCRMSLSWFYCGIYPHSSLIAWGRANNSAP